MAEGRFIVFEGIDGSGLTTQAELLRNWLLKEERECYLTKEPSEGPIGAIIRLILARRLDIIRPENELEHALALLFAADRMDHLTNRILPTLSKGVHVICDRYYLSSFAYQGLGVDFDAIKTMNARCRPPDLTIFLDVPVEICKKRIERQRWHVDLYEDVEKLEKVREKFLGAIRRLVLEGHVLEIVDGNDTPQNVHKSVLQLVRKALAKNHMPMPGQLSFRTEPALTPSER